MLTLTENLLLGDDFSRLELRDELFNGMLHDKLDKDKKFLDGISYFRIITDEAATRISNIVSLEGKRYSPFASMRKSS